MDTLALDAAAKARGPDLTVSQRTDFLRGELRRLYPANRYALLEEVANGTGFAGRYADAVALCLWPSDYHRLHGFEIKASRSDWLRELKNPRKSEAVAKYCDTWTLLSWTDVAREEEIPKGWRWWFWDGKKIRKALRGQGWDPLHRPQWSKDFVAAMVRRAVQAGPSAAFVAAAVLETQRRGVQEASWDREDLEKLHHQEVQDLAGTIKRLRSDHCPGCECDADEVLAKLKAGGFVHG